MKYDEHRCDLWFLMVRSDENMKTGGRGGQSPFSRTGNFCISGRSLNTNEPANRRRSPRRVGGILREETTLASLRKVLPQRKHASQPSQKLTSVAKIKM